MPAMTAARENVTKGDRTRRRLLDAAAALVARRGLDAISLGDIAAEAGLKTGSIYFHFASKEQLIETVLEEGLIESLRHLDEALAAVPDDADAGARLWAAVHAHLKALLVLSDYATIVLTLREHTEGAAAGAYRKLKHRYGGQWAELIDDAQRSAVLPAELDPRMVRDLLFGAMNSTLGTAGRAGRSPEQVTRTIKELLDRSDPGRHTGSTA
jgi:AcrR family transcriptional regulator